MRWNHYRSDSTYSTSQKLKCASTCRIASSALPFPFPRVHCMRTLPPHPHSSRPPPRTYPETPHQLPSVHSPSPHPRTIPRCPPYAHATRAVPIFTASPPQQAPFSPPPPAVSLKKWKACSARLFTAPDQSTERALSRAVFHFTPTPASSRVSLPVTARCWYYPSNGATTAARRPGAPARRRPRRRRASRAHPTGASRAQCRTRR